MDRDFCTAIAIFDFSKAFHSVPDCCLFSKLNQYYLCGRPGSVLKPKPRPRFCGRPNQNRKSVFTGPSRFLSRTRQTKGVAHRLNDAVFGQPFVKRFALCYQTVVCLSCLSVTFVHCGQTVGWIKMKLGMRVGLGHGHIVLDGDPALPPPKGHSPPNFQPISVAAKWLHGSRRHLVWS